MFHYLGEGSCCKQVGRWFPVYRDIKKYIFYVFVDHISDIKMKFVNIMLNLAADFPGVLRMKPIQAVTWLSCWASWTLGSMQFYLLPFTLTKLAEFLDVKQSKISEANTTTMLSRALGAVIFGVASDQYGRKTPMMVNLVCLAVFTMCTGFVQTYGQLIGVRFLFGPFPPWSVFIMYWNPRD